MKTPRPAETSRGPGGNADQPWHLRLYIAGLTPSSVAAVRNIKLLEAEYLPAGSTVEIIDVLQDPAAAQRSQILAIPTVVRLRPGPVRRIVGSLEDIQKTLKVLGYEAA